MPIRVSLPDVRSPACLRVETKKRKERKGVVGIPKRKKRERGSWDTQKRRRSRRSSGGA
jgi:hypothetical protein